MWYTWTTLLLVSCALVEAELGAEAATEATTDATTDAASVATTRAPPRTLDRQAAELAWKTWLQSPESGSQNAPPRRITTKSLFITPLVCPKGQRLDRNGCVQVVTINETEHERNLLNQLNALFTSAPSGDVLYDYGDEDPGPLQLSIPIGLDPQAAPLQGQEPSAQAQELQSNYVKVNKKDVNGPGGDEAAALEAELELLKLQSTHNSNNTAPDEGSDILNHNVLTNIHSYPEKPKRNSPMVNSSEIESLSDTTDEGQKEIVFGHVNVDPVMYNAENERDETESTEVKESIGLPNLVNTQNNTSTITDFSIEENKNSSSIHNGDTSTENKTLLSSNSQNQALKIDNDQSKINPENDYSDIGEAIKLISRYADVTTDDNFTKDQNKLATKDDTILGTRTKLQYRRNKPKQEQIVSVPANVPQQLAYNQNSPSALYANNGVYYRYPWPGQNSPTPPPDYPFRHLQDYWPGRNQVGGVYNTHENPRRHHHSYPHNYRLHGYPHAGYVVGQSEYPEQLKGYLRRIAQHQTAPMRPPTNNQDLYSLLGLRHWFSSEGTSNR